MKSFVLVLLFMLIVVPCMAQSQVNFAWDPHSQAADITGFKLYLSKQSGVYPINPAATFVGGTLTTGSIPAPASPGKYFFTLTAYMPEAESDRSNEIFLVIKPKPPKLNTAQQVASAIKNGIIKFAGLFKADKQFRFAD